MKISVYTDFTYEYCIKDKVVGTLYLEEFKNYVVIKNIAVSKKYQSKGVGKALVDSIKGLKKIIILEVIPDEPKRFWDLVRFYNKLGFKFAHKYTKRKMIYCPDAEKRT